MSKTLRDKMLSKRGHRDPYLEEGRTRRRRRSKPSNLDEYTDLPSFESSSRSKLGWPEYGSDLNFTYLANYLRKQVDRLWDDVYSDLCKELNPRKATDRHVLSYFESHFLTPCSYGENGEAYGSGWRTGRVDIRNSWSSQWTDLYLDKEGYLRFRKEPQISEYLSAKTGPRLQTIIGAYYLNGQWLYKDPTTGTYWHLETTDLQEPQTQFLIGGGDKGKEKIRSTGRYNSSHTYWHVVPHKIHREQRGDTFRRWFYAHPTKPVSGPRLKHFEKLIEHHNEKRRDCRVDRYYWYSLTPLIKPLFLDYESEEIRQIIHE